MSRLSKLRKLNQDHNKDWVETLAELFGLAYQNAPAFQKHVDEYNLCHSRYGDSIAQGLDYYVRGTGLCHALKY